MEVPQLRQAAQLLQAMLGVGPAEDCHVFESQQVRDHGRGIVVEPRLRAILGDIVAVECQRLEAVSSAITEGASSLARSSR